MKNRMRILLMFIIGICSLFILSCNESLPAREDLSSLVTIKARSTYNTVSRSNNAGTLRLLITAFNKTDETLDDIAALTGTVEVTWVRPKEDEGLMNRTRTFKLTPNDIFYAKNFNTQTHRLTLAPGDSVVLSVVWDMMTDNGDYLLNYFPTRRDSLCMVFFLNSTSYGPRKITQRQYFSVRANVKIFDRLAVLYSQEIQVGHCFMLLHGGEDDINKGLHMPPCADFTQFDPCSVIGP